MSRDDVTREHSAIMTGLLPQPPLERCQTVISTDFMAIRLRLYSSGMLRGLMLGVKKFSSF